MNAIIKALEDDQLKKDLPDFKTGDVVRVSVRIKEGERERLQMFEGVVLKRQNGGVRETFTVRRLSHGTGVERTWPVHSPNVADIEVIRPGQVRRAKLYYLRERIGKNARVKELIR